MDKGTHTEDEPFKPVRLHDKTWLIVLGMLAVVGFIIMLAMYAQPSPPGAAVEQIHAKNTVRTKPKASDVEAQAVPSIDVNTSGDAGAISPGVSTAMPSDADDMLPVQADEHSGRGTNSGNMQNSVSGELKQAVNTLQTTVSPIKLLR